MFANTFNIKILFECQVNPSCNVEVKLMEGFYSCEHDSSQIAFFMWFYRTFPCIFCILKTCVYQDCELLILFCDFNLELEDISHKTPELVIQI
jgi:hypothetical protein